YGFNSDEPNASFTLPPAQIVNPVRPSRWRIGAASGYLLSPLTAVKRSRFFEPHPLGFSEHFLSEFLRYLDARSTGWRTCELNANTDDVGGLGDINFAVIDEVISADYVRSTILLMERNEGCIRRENPVRVQHFFHPRFRRVEGEFQLGIDLWGCLSLCLKSLPGSLRHVDQLHRNWIKERIINHESAFLILVPVAWGKQR